MNNNQTNNEVRRLSTGTTPRSTYTLKSNEQRLKSIDQHEEEKRQRKRLIKESLKNPLATKHVKFDSDDDDNQGKIFVEKKIQLFDDQESTINADEHFVVKKISKKSRQLRNLQAQLTNTNDPRFQLSESFLDNHQKQQDEDEEEKEISFEDEKKKSLAILDQISSGKSSTPKASKSKMIRFDPTKTEHRIYELNSEMTINGKIESSVKETRPRSILKVPKDTTPITDPTRVYDLDTNRLKNLFDKSTKPTENSNSEGSFQFQFFNSFDSVAKSTITPTAIPNAKPVSNGKSTKFPKQVDNSSSEDDDEGGQGKVSSHESNGIAEETKSKTFFFFDDDNRLKDGLENFVRNEDLQELERSWPTKRREIAEALRSKHRKAIQRKDKHRIFNHRRRHQQQQKPRPSKVDLD